MISLDHSHLPLAPFLALPALVNCQSGVWRKQYKPTYVGTNGWFISSRDGGGSHINCESQAGGQNTIHYWLSCGARACRSLGYVSGQVSENMGTHLAAGAVLTCCKAVFSIPGARERQAYVAINLGRMTLRLGRC